MKMRVKNGMILLNITRKQLIVILCEKTACGCTLFITTTKYITNVKIFG